MEVPDFDMDEEGRPLGEVVALPPDMITKRLSDQSEPPDYMSHARKVADFIDIGGRHYRSGLSQAQAERRADGRYDVLLKSHKKTIIMLGGSLLFAAGVGANLQFNRTHRKKNKR